MEPQFSHPHTERPLRTDSDGVAVMPEWSEDDIKKPAKPKRSELKAEPKAPRKRVARELQPDATHLDSITQAKQWLEEHPEEAAMLRAAQTVSGDILANSGVEERHYSSSEAASFFNKTVQWLYWGMRHAPHGGRLFVRPVLDDDGNQIVCLHDDDGEPIFDEHGEPILDGPKDKMRPLIEDIPVPRIGDPRTGNRRFDVPTIREFAKSAYNRGNIKEPKLRAVLERLVVAERGGNWKSIPIPTRPGDVDGGPT